LTSSSKFIDCARSFQVAGSKHGAAAKRSGQGGMEESRHHRLRGTARGQRMRVQFTSSGGFAGLIRQCRLDTATMPPDDGAQLERLVRQSGLSASGEKLSSRGRDLEQYDITIEDGARRISVVLDTSTLPAAAKPLVGYLKKCAPRAVSPMRCPCATVPWARGPAWTTGRRRAGRRA
jgi:hypothetical protein